MNIQDRLGEALQRHAHRGEDEFLEAAYEDQHGYPEEDADDGGCWDGDEIDD